MFPYFQLFFLTWRIQYTSLSAHWRLIDVWLRVAATRERDKYDAERGRDSLKNERERLPHSSTSVDGECSDFITIRQWQKNDVGSQDTRYNRADCLLPVNRYNRSEERASLHTGRSVNPREWGTLTHANRHRLEHYRCWKTLRPLLRTYSSQNKE